VSAMVLDLMSNFQSGVDMFAKWLSSSYSLDEEVV
jgi:hypothetical protein